MGKSMNSFETKAIQTLGKRSYTFVFIISTFFALSGAALAIYTGGVGLWGLWIPLCFLVIPAIHHMSKMLMEMEERLTRLENETTQQGA